VLDTLTEIEALIDGKQLAAVCRINALWRLHCCALPVCGFGEGRREAHASTESDIDRVFAAIDQMRAGGMLVGADAFLFSRRDQLVQLAARYSIATVYPRREAVLAGGLASYGHCGCLRCCRHSCRAHSEGRKASGTASPTIRQGGLGEF
jgi:hypothetical protein